MFENEFEKLYQSQMLCIYRRGNTNKKLNPLHSKDRALVSSSYMQTFFVPLAPGTS